MFPPPNVALGALSPATFCKLADELDNISGAVNFITTFLELLPRRVTRILQAVQSSNDLEAMEAVLSLKVTSAMAGAHSMEELCVLLETALNSGNSAEASRATAELSNATRSFGFVHTDSPGGTPC
ncbi:Hpt domain-containing protein [Arthrobacter monumenti]